MEHELRHGLAEAFSAQVGAKLEIVCMSDSFAIRLSANSATDSPSDRAIQSWKQRQAMYTI